MLEQVNVIKIINVPSCKVWQAISAIGGLDRWFPIINSCRVEGKGVGAIRILGLADGAEVKDCIKEIHDQDNRFRYLRTHHPFPVSYYEGTVNVRDVDKGKCEVSWSVQIKIVKADRDEFTGLLKQALSDGISGLEQYLQPQSINIRGFLP